jgi:uncharacterized membrane protein
MATAPTEITDVLGRVRPVKYSYPAGEWNCPFCLAAVCPERTPCYVTACTFGAHCPNPACFANPHYPVERAREELAKAERREKEERERKATHEWAMKRAEEARQAQAAAAEALRQKAIEIGACVRCALASSNYKKKLVKHRGPCPRDRR